MGPVQIYITKIEGREQTFLAGDDSVFSAWIQPEEMARRPPAPKPSVLSSYIISLSACGQRIHMAETAAQSQLAIHCTVQVAVVGTSPIQYAFLRG